jgi:general stress protein YciG
MAVNDDRGMTAPVGDQGRGSAMSGAGTSSSNSSGNSGSGASDDQGFTGRGRGTSRRGFASMDPERQREIASKGGRAAHAKGTAHEWSADEAREAGRKGGETVSRDRAHMAAIGREGGGARSANRRAQQQSGRDDRHDRH